MSRGSYLSQRGKNRRRPRKNFAAIGAEKGDEDGKKPIGLPYPSASRNPCISFVTTFRLWICHFRSLLSFLRERT